MKKKLLTALVVITGMFLLSASIVWAQPAPVPKTGQTSSYRTGDDGYYQKGVSVSPRFTDHGDGTVTDNLTGLMWAKNVNDNGTMIWNDAIDYANNLSLGTEGCGTTYTDWRLPNLFELESLRDMRNFNPALPSGHPFTNVQNGYYWSSTTHPNQYLLAWYMSFFYGYIDYNNKASYYNVWPVRSAD
jgi:hypothetical protein